MRQKSDDVLCLHCELLMPRYVQRLLRRNSMHSRKTEMGRIDIDCTYTYVTFLLVIRSCQFRISRESSHGRDLLKILRISHRLSFRVCQLKPCLKCNTLLTSSQNLTRRVSSRSRMRTSLVNDNVHTHTCILLLLVFLLSVLLFVHFLCKQLHFVVFERA